MGARDDNATRRDRGRLTKLWLLFLVVGGLLLIGGRHAAILQNWRAFVGVFFVLLTVGLPLVMLMFQRQGTVETVGLGIAVAPMVLVVLACLLRGVVGLSFLETAVSLLIGWVGLQALFLWRCLRPIVYLRPMAYLPTPPDWVAVLTGVIAVLTGVIVVLAIAYPQFTSTDIQLSFHGCYHSAIVYELRAGQFPPTNPVMPGEPINFYWVYHLLLALLMEALNVSPIQASAALNVTILIGVLCMGWILAGQLKLRRGTRTLACMLATTGVNWAGFVVWLKETVRTGDLAPHRAMVIQGDPRVSNMASKFINFSGFPTGYLSAMLALYGLTRISQNRRGGLALLSVGIASALLLHTTTGVALVTFAPAAMLISWLVQWLTRRQPLPWRRLLDIGGAIMLAAMAAAPVVIPAATALWGPGPSFGHTPGFFPTVALALGPLVIIAVLGMLLWYRNARLIEWYLLCWGFALVLGALLVVFPANNQYKFVYLASQPLGLLAAWGIQQWSKSARRPWGATVVAGLVIGIVLLNTVVCSISYVGQARRATLPSTVPVESEGTRVDITTSLENYRDAYAWVREHTAPDALFVEAPQDNARRLFPLITQRMLYVSAFNLSYMFQESPEFEARWQMAGLLFTPSIPKQDALAQVATAAPEIYFLLESDALGENYTPLKEEFDRMEQLNLVFDNPNVKIYRFEHRDERSNGTETGGLSEGTLVEQIAAALT